MIREVKVYSEESHLKYTTDNIKALYFQLKDAILNIGPNVTLKPRAKYITFIHNTNFVDIVIRRSNLTLFINLENERLHDPKKISRDVSQVGHWGSGDYQVTVNEAGDIVYALSLIRQSYDSN